MRIRQFHASLLYSVALALFALSTPAKSDEALRALVPTDIRSQDTLQIPSQGNYPPYEFLQDGSDKYVGIDIDIMNGIAKILDLKPSYVTTGVPAIIPAIQNGRYSISISALFDRPSDQAQVDFVDYLQSGTILLVQKGNPKSIKSWDGLCGLRAMGTSGQPSLLLIEEQNKKCLADGKAAIEVQTAPGTAVRLQALQSDRTDAIPTDYAVGTYLSQTVADTYEVAAPPDESHLLGIAFRKGDSDFQKAVLGALQLMKQNGEYAAILDKWGVPNLALSEFTINGATQK